LGFPMFPGDIRAFDSLLRQGASFFQHVIAALRRIKEEEAEPLSTQKMGGPLGFPHFCIDIRAFDSLWGQGAQ
jgi:hypothetical protein